MSQGLFVTGTDTGVGKTLTSAALIHAIARLGLRTAGVKPVAAGCQWQGDRLVSDDVSLLNAAANVVLPAHVVNPYAFAPPIAPHIAARDAGQAISLQTIQEAVSTARQSLDMVVVEGVGGFRVPLNDTQDTADLAVALGLPVLLVVGVRLGCLNHALLTVEAIQARGLQMVGWVANTVDPEMLALPENLVALQEKISVPCWGVIPYMGHADFRIASEKLQLPEHLIRGYPLNKNR